MCKLFTEDASSFRSPSGSFKSLVGGCLGGIFIETRPVNSGIMS